MQAKAKVPSTVPESGQPIRNSTATTNPKMLPPMTSIAAPANPKCNKAGLPWSCGACAIKLAAA